MKQLENFDIFLNSGFTGLSEDAGLKKSIRNSSLSFREDRLLDSIGVLMDTETFIKTLVDSKSPLTKREIELAEELKINHDYEPIIMTERDEYTRIVGQFLASAYPQIISEVSQCSTDEYDRLILDINTASDVTDKIINKENKEITIDPLKLLMIKKGTESLNPTGTLKYPTLKFLNGLRRTYLDDKESTVEVLIQNDEIVMKYDLSLPEMLLGLFYESDLTYNEANWLRQLIDTTVYNPWIYPILPRELRELSVYFLVYLEILSRKYGTSPRNILSAVITESSPKETDEFIIYGSTLRDTILISKDTDDIAIVEERIMNDVKLSDLVFKDGVLCSGFSTLADIFCEHDILKSRNVLVRR